MTDTPASPPIPSLWDRLKANLIALSYAVDGSEADYCHERLNAIEARLAALEMAEPDRQFKN